jgi:hypothetical protein
MTSISHLHHERCPRCGSELVSLEWDERVNSREVPDLWHCCKCQNEFTTVEASADFDQRNHHAILYELDHG